jgi:hypothetical protein
MKLAANFDFYMTVALAGRALFHERVCGATNRSVFPRSSAAKTEALLTSTVACRWQ